MNKNNLFSILTPTKNRATNFLPIAIQSVQNQLRGNFDYEHIIINDGSTDNTEQVVKEFAKTDKRIKYIKIAKSVGPARALNVGFKRSVGNLITTLDDDDLLLPSSLLLRFQFMNKHPKIDWTSGFLINIDKNSRLYFDLLEQVTPANINPKNFFNAMLEENRIKSNTVTVRRKCLDKIGGWDKNVKAGQDWALGMDLIYHGFKYALIQNYLAFYRIHKKQRSTTFRKNAAWNITRDYFLKKYNV